MTGSNAGAAAAATRTNGGREYAYRARNERIDRTVAFAEVDPTLDFDRLRAWFGSDHVKPYWQLDLPEAAFRAKLDSKLGDDHLTPYVGLLDHTPMSYWETYRAADDAVGERYDAEPEDRGVHLLIGPPEYLGHGYAVPLLRAITAFQFRATDAGRVVSEPDVRNEIAIRVFERCGYEPQGRIDLPDKEALLMHCERERFFDAVGEPADVDVDVNGGSDADTAADAESEVGR
ncbi:iron transport protein B [Haloferax gibbonsii ATCC 33959]|uniref:Iron transport protein B n=1 Tax=Haloferax gibbonsii (strain ATCC 33959 / DSM 4427 / JCM 8863 / NBRC 102184 / NCIMB 2188 / Ma 2.38) TaxID=1227459 RepID=M0HQD3_HALGM|nr:GNAT family N-acetyltransferase [Haloferax gibbonsii]ELZ85309.1 iron transport protein B [Haloferax gibbonsii ATCC 33959]